MKGKIGDTHWDLNYKKNKSIQIKLGKIDGGTGGIAKEEEKHISTYNYSTYVLICQVAISRNLGNDK